MLLFFAYPLLLLWWFIVFPPYLLLLSHFFLILTLRSSLSLRAIIACFFCLFGIMMMIFFPIIELMMIVPVQRILTPKPAMRIEMSRKHLMHWSKMIVRIVAIAETKALSKWHCCVNSPWEEWYKPWLGQVVCSLCVWMLLWQERMSRVVICWNRIDSKRCHTCHSCNGMFHSILIYLL